MDDKDCSELDCADDIEEELRKRGVEIGVFERWMTRRAAQIVSAARAHEKEAAKRFTILDQRFERVENALYHPTEGLVNIRTWMCLLVKRAAFVAAGTVAFVVSVLSMLHFLKVI